MKIIEIHEVKNSSEKKEKVQTNLIIPTNSQPQLFNLKDYSIKKERLSIRKKLIQKAYEQINW